MKILFLVAALILLAPPASVLRVAHTGSSVSAPLTQTHPLLVNSTIGDPAAVAQGHYSFSAYRPLLPGVKPTVINIVEDAIFNNTGPVPYTTSVVLPNTASSLALLNVSVREYGGAQFDRPLYVFADGVPIFWGSTQEIYNSTGVSDVTLYENMLRGKVTFEVVLVNFYDKAVGITGVYEVNVSLELYPGTPPAGLPTTFVPLWVNRFGYSNVRLNPFHPSYSEQVSLPGGTYRAAAIVYTEGGGNDEFWYANEPATRSVLLYYNGFLADVVNPYETIYTGGIDPFYWKPMPSINTLAFHNPYLAEITPLLAAGLNATLSVTVTNLVESYELTGSPFFSWTLSGALALWVNQSNSMVGGRLEEAKQVYMDSSPIFNPSFSGEVYQEAGHYMLEYAATLSFESGKEHTVVVQKGSFQAYQSFNSIVENAKLDESFYEYANDTGLYDSTLLFEGNYPISLSIASFATPITNPSVIPYQAVLPQNGSLTLGLQALFTYTYGKSTYSQSVSEKLEASGGFSVVLEVINQYGGAVVVSINANYAQTAKTLKAQWLIDGQSVTETFAAKAVSPNVTDSAGYYTSITTSYS